MKKAVFSLLVLVMTIGLQAQTPEWSKYCEIRSSMRNMSSPDSIYSGFYQMDSIYNGIPVFDDLVYYLTFSIRSNHIEKAKEIALRLARTKCWDIRIWSNAEFEIIRKSNIWPQLKCLAKSYGHKSRNNEFMSSLYLMATEDRTIREKLYFCTSDDEFLRISDSMRLQQDQHICRLTELIDKYGFPTWEKVGNHYSNDACVLALHSNPEFMHCFVEQLKKAVQDENGSISELAYLIDRDLTNQNLPQLYGTQSMPFEGSGFNQTADIPLWPIEDIEHLNERREHMLLPPIDLSQFKVADIKDIQQ